MMRRKKKQGDEAAVPKPLPPGVTPLPPRPKGIDKAAQELAKKLETNAVAGFGFADAGAPVAKREAVWRIYVFTGDDELAARLPAEHAGFPVARRAAANSCAPWGKIAKRRAAGEG